MRGISIRTIAASWLVLAGLASAEGGRISAFGRYGIGGHIQSIGLHHGFHIETVMPDSDAARAELRPNDVIVKVDGEVIRSLDHLRAVLAEAYLDDAEVTITYTRGDSIAHRAVTSRLGRGDEKRLAKKRPRATDETR